MTDNEMYSMFITCGPLVSAKVWSVRTLVQYLHCIRKPFGHFNTYLTGQGRTTPDIDDHALYV